MKKLFINLLLISGIDFSLHAASERELIYQEECDKKEAVDSEINPVPFDRSSKRFEFDGSRENLTECWFVEGKRVSDLEQLSLGQVENRKPGPTFCFINTEFLPGGRKYKKEHEQNLSPSERSWLLLVVHTKYNLNPNDPEYEKKRLEAESYQQRVNRYNQLKRAARLKEMQENLGNKHDRSQTATHLDPNSSGQ